MKKKILLLLLTASFAFTLFIPTQYSSDSKIKSNSALHGT